MACRRQRITFPSRHQHRGCGFSIFLVQLSPQLRSSCLCPFAKLHMMTFIGQDLHAPGLVELLCSMVEVLENVHGYTPFQVLDTHGQPLVQEPTYHPCILTQTSNICRTEKTNHRFPSPDYYGWPGLREKQTWGLHIVKFELHRLLYHAARSEKAKRQDDIYID